MIPDIGVLGEAPLADLAPGANVIFCKYFTFN
jgi:hypothetical protein